MPWAHRGHRRLGGRPQPAQAGQVPGDALTPVDALERFGADAVRYWAAGKRAGVDTTWDEGQLRVGRRLGHRFRCNAPRFVLALDGLAAAEATDTGTAMLAGLAGVVDEATAAFEAYEPACASRPARPSSGASATTTWSWSRAGPTGRPARPARRSARRGPCAWPWTRWRACSPPCCRSSPRRSGRGWRDGSVHRSPWPEGGPLRAATGVEGPSPLALSTAAAVLAEIRRAKTAARVSLRAPAGRVGVADRPERLAVPAEVAADPCRAGHVADLALLDPADTLTVTVDLLRRVARAVSPGRGSAPQALVAERRRLASDPAGGRGPGRAGRAAGLGSGQAPDRSSAKRSTAARRLALEAALGLGDHPDPAGVDPRAQAAQRPPLWRPRSATASRPGRSGARPASRWCWTPCSPGPEVWLARNSSSATGTATSGVIRTTSSSSSTTSLHTAQT